MLKISGGLVVTDRIEKKNLYIENGVIVALTEKELPYDELIDAEGNYVSPGFVDTHVHGGGGFDFQDGTAEAVIGASDFHFRHGTTSIMPTLLADAVAMMSKNPCLAYGIKNKGEIRVEYDADIAIFDEGINVKKVVVKHDKGVKIINM